MTRFAKGFLHRENYWLNVKGNDLAAYSGCLEQPYNAAFIQAI